jgi:hypothetical protein
MDTVLESRWRGDLAPFDGLIAVSPLLSEAELRSQLELVVGLLPQKGVLATLEDWHQHDGYLAESTIDSYANLAGVIAMDAEADPPKVLILVQGKALSS